MEQMQLASAGRCRYDTILQAKGIFLLSTSKVAVYILMFLFYFFYLS